MARRRKSFFRRSASRAGRFVRRGTKTQNAQLIQVDAMLYGAVRAPISNFLQGLLPNNVLGNIGDEVVMGATNYLIAKNTSGMVRDVARKGLVVENARLGEALVGMTGLTQAASNAGNNALAYNY